MNGRADQAMSNGDNCWR